jgi:hypothetical protein
MIDQILNGVHRILNLIFLIRQKKHSFLPFSKQVFHFKYLITKFSEIFNKN